MDGHEHAHFADELPAFPSHAPSLPERFLRTHRSWIVNLDCVREAHPWSKRSCVLVTRDGLKVPVGHQYRDALQKILG